MIWPDGSYWQQLFDDHPMIDRVVLEADDLTVYFEGSDEPFPFTSLKDGALKRSITGIADLM